MSLERGSGVWLKFDQAKNICNYWDTCFFHILTSLKPGCILQLWLLAGVVGIYVPFPLWGWGPVEQSLSQWFVLPSLWFIVKYWMLLVLPCLNCLQKDDTLIQHHIRKLLACTQKHREKQHGGMSVHVRKAKICHSRNDFNPTFSCNTEAKCFMGIKKGRNPHTGSSVFFYEMVSQVSLKETEERLKKTKYSQLPS